MKGQKSIRSRSQIGIAVVDVPVGRGAERVDNVVHEVYHCVLGGESAPGATVDRNASCYWPGTNKCAEYRFKKRYEVLGVLTEVVWCLWNSVIVAAYSTVTAMWWIKRSSALLGSTTSKTGNLPRLKYGAEVLFETRFMISQSPRSSISLIRHYLWVCQQSDAQRCRL